MLLAVVVVVVDDGAVAVVRKGFANSYVKPPTVKERDAFRIDYEQCQLREAPGRNDISEVGNFTGEEKV